MRKTQKNQKCVSLFFLFPFLLLFLSACSTPLEKKHIVNGSSPANPHHASGEQGLTEEEALLRFSMVRDVEYELFFDLDGKEDQFKGKTLISFEVNGNPHSFPQPLRIDFSQGSIQELAVNDQVLSQFEYNGSLLLIPKEKLMPGRNRIFIQFTHPYSKSGEGLHRFVDPEDDQVYLYTNFEPYDANKLFPCFDQPDLKATYTLKVRAPRTWTVLSSVPEERKDLLGEKMLWHFPRSAKFSTYIFPLMAGPYHIWESQSGKIPLRLLSRESLARYVAPDVKEWFTITSQGLEFFQKYFDFAYPYKKYDQIIVPEFNSGAMENVGAVTFSERYVYRDRPNRNDREGRANTILHELSHMWFGDLVTMKWWNGLWLNESFATYMAHLALEKATEFKSIWQSFFAKTKQWAYWEDQLVTTHAIETPVRNTEEAFAHFDGITYGKGASALKQLDYFLGADTFQKGVQHYFKTHAHKNTELSDFFASMEKSSGRSLAEWVENWPKRPGPNTLKAVYECTTGEEDTKNPPTLKSFKLVQGYPKEHPYLRDHRAKVALFKEDAAGKLVIYRMVDVSYRDRETPVWDLVGEKCPSLVYPNTGDHDYVKVLLDHDSFQTAKEKIHLIKDPLARTMVWMGLWDKVVDAEWPLQNFIDLALTHIGDEEDFILKSKVVGLLEEEARQYLPEEGEDFEQVTQKTLVRMEEFFWKHFLKSPPHSETKKMWFDAFVHTATTPESLKQLATLMNSPKVIKGMDLDQDRRWEVLTQLNTFLFPSQEETQKWLEKEVQLDPSDRGIKMKIGAEASRPQWEVKKKWLETIHQEEASESLARMKTAMRHLFPHGQINLHRKFAQEFYRQLPQLVQKKGPSFLSSYVSTLVPSFCGLEGSQEIRQFLEDHPQLPANVVKQLRVAQQEDERCMKIRALMKGPVTL